jgi:hypothetical protein
LYKTNLFNIGQIQEERGKESRDFLERLDIAHVILDEYYTKTDLFLIYAAALILNPRNRTRYIKAYWPKRWAKPILAIVKKL